MEFFSQRKNRPVARGVDSLTRIDFGLALAKYKSNLPKRLITTGGAAKKDRNNTPSRIDVADKLDREFRTWVQIAYDLDECVGESLLHGSGMSRIIQRHHHELTLGGQETLPSQWQFSVHFNIDGH